MSDWQLAVSGISVGIALGVIIILLVDFWTKDE